jgi:hypothetical protein
VLLALPELRSELLLKLPCEGFIVFDGRSIPRHGTGGCWLEARREPPPILNLGLTSRFVHDTEDKQEEGARWRHEARESDARSSSLVSSSRDRGTELNQKQAKVFVRGGIAASNYFYVQGPETIVPNKRTSPVGRVFRCSLTRRNPFPVGPRASGLLGAVGTRF